MGGGLRLRTQRLRIGLAEQRLRGLGLASVGPCAGAAEEQPQAARASASARLAENPDMPFPRSRCKSPDAGGLAFSSPLRGQSWSTMVHQNLT